MTGITENGFEIKRLPEIKQQLEEGMRVVLGADATLLPDSVEGQFIAVLSEEYARLWEELKSAYDAFNPSSVTDQTLDNLVFLNGLTRNAPLPSTAIIDITGVDGTIIPAGSIVRHSATSAEFLTAQAVEIGIGFPAGAAQVVATARKNGPTEALAGTLTDIASPVNGWNTAVNSVNAVEGRFLETDAELRTRRDRSVTVAGSSSLINIITEVARVPGVVHAGGVENFTNTVDAFGLPPHSFEIVAVGGVDNLIGEAIWIKKPVGIEAHGTTTVGVSDILGGSHSVKFTRPTDVRIYLRANVTFIGNVPDSADEQLGQAVLDYVNGKTIPGVELGVGDDVLNSRLYVPFNTKFHNHTINSLETSTDGINYSSADIPIEFNEVSVWSLADMDIIVG